MRIHMYHVCVCADVMWVCVCVCVCADVVCVCVRMSCECVCVCVCGRCVSVCMCLLKHNDALWSPHSDQTPTPTRFLRNCEEAGLFQELENPFDQDFQEATKTNGDADNSEDTNSSIGKELKYYPPPSWKLKPVAVDTKTSVSFNKLLWSIHQGSSCLKHSRNILKDLNVTHLGKDLNCVHNSEFYKVHFRILSWLCENSNLISCSQVGPFNKCILFRWCTFLCHRDCQSRHHSSSPAPYTCQSWQASCHGVCPYTHQQHLIADKAEIAPVNPGKGAAENTGASDQSAARCARLLSVLWPPPGSEEHVTGEWLELSWVCWGGGGGGCAFTTYITDFAV